MLRVVRHVDSPAGVVPRGVSTPVAQLAEVDDVGAEGGGEVNEGWHLVEVVGLDGEGKLQAVQGIEAAEHGKSGQVDAKLSPVASTIQSVGLGRGGIEGHRDLVDTFLGGSKLLPAGLVAQQGIGKESNFKVGVPVPGEVVEEIQVDGRREWISTAGNHDPLDVGKRSRIDETQ